MAYRIEMADGVIEVDTFEEAIALQEYRTARRSVNARAPAPPSTSRTDPAITEETVGIGATRFRLVTRRTSTFRGSCTRISPPWCSLCGLRIDAGCGCLQRGDIHGVRRSADMAAVAT